MPQIARLAGRGRKARLWRHWLSIAIRELVGQPGDRRRPNAPPEPRPPPQTSTMTLDDHPLPGEDRDTFEDEERIVGFPGGEDAVLREPTIRPRLETRRSSTADGETLTIAFQHRPPSTSQTGTLIPGEIEAALTYYDPQQALEDACEFVTAALAAVRANVRRARG